jgi:hypothetical protein
MNALRFALAALLVASTASFANAMDFSIPEENTQAVEVDDATLAEISEAATETAADVMSPDELFVERSQDFSFDNILEKRTKDSSSTKLQKARLRQRKQCKFT